MRAMRRALPYLLMMASACGGTKAPARPAAADAHDAAIAHQTAVATQDLAPVPPPRATFVASDIRRIDTHTHIEPGALSKAIALLGAHHIVHIVNLSGGSPGGDGLEDTLAEAKRVGHTTVFVNPDFREAKKGAGYGARIAAKIKVGHTLGARGVKISKGLGLGFRDGNGQ